MAHPWSWVACPRLRFLDSASEFSTAADSSSLAEAVSRFARVEIADFVSVALLSFFILLAVFFGISSSTSGAGLGGDSMVVKGVTLMRRLGAAARPVGAAGAEEAEVFLVDLVGLMGGFDTVFSTTASSSSTSSSSSGSIIGVFFVERLAVRPVFVVAILVVAGAGFLVTRDFA